MRHTVLIVEDEPDLMLALRILLDATGYEVLEAPTGEVALAVLAKTTPDVMVLDIMLPGIDGWEVLDQLRRSDVGATLPVIVASANASPDQARRAKEFDCAALLTKPFDPDQFSRLVDRLVHVAR